MQDNSIFTIIVGINGSGKNFDTVFIANQC